MDRLKHLILCCLLITVATSCNDISNGFELPKTDNLKSDVRGVDEILSIAEKAYEAISHDSRSTLSLTRENIILVLTSKSRTDGAPVIYAVNYGDEKGFALVASSKYE